MHPTLRRCYDIAIKGAWHHPFFLVPLGHVSWNLAGPEIPTMAVCRRMSRGEPVISLHINEKWTSRLKDEEIFAVLCHEILHVMLDHFSRGEGLNRQDWGIATDMAINASLETSGMTFPAGVYFPPKEHWTLTAEELYDLMQAGELDYPGRGEGYGDPQPGQGCLPQDSDPAEGDAAGRRAWDEMTAQATFQGRGTKTMEGLAPLLRPAVVRVSWRALLRRVANRAVSGGGRDYQTFTRTSRKSTHQILFPGWGQNHTSVAVVVDTSGSVDDQSLAEALTSVKEIARVSKLRVFLALHDAECYWSGWVSESTSFSQLSSRVTCRGGTVPGPAFEAVQKARAKFNVLVYLTDGEVGEYPASPNNVKSVLVGLVANRPYATSIPAGWSQVKVSI